MKISPEIVGLLLLVSGASPGLASASGLAMERFERSIVPLGEILGASDSAETLARSLPDSLARILAFRLQATFRLYGDSYAHFKDHKKAVKKLEDEIGDLDLARKQLKYARAHGRDEATVRRLEKAEREAFAELLKLLEEGEWTDGKIDEIHADLENTEWGSDPEDRKLVLGAIESHLREVDGTEFDLDELEDGIHELRREIRWFLMHADASNGLIQLGTQCPVAAYRPLLTAPVARSKYAQLPRNSRVRIPCRVSRCLYLAAVDAVEKIGALKDEGEGRAGSGDDDVDDLARQAKEIHSGVRKSRLLERLTGEVAGCRR